MKENDPFYEIDEYINDLVDEWHDSPRIKSGLQEFLGMNDKQYAAWVREPHRFYSSGSGQLWIEETLGRRNK